MARRSLKHLYNAQVKAPSPSLPRALTFHLLAGPNKRVTKVYSSSKASLFQRRPEPIQSMRPRPTGRKILRRAREEEAGYVVSV
ncbi:hypothetical protein LguiA_035959 [Lonicera macranthoides]